MSELLLDAAGRRRSPATRVVHSRFVMAPGPAARLLVVVRLSSQRARQGVRQDCSSVKKRESPPALLVVVRGDSQRALIVTSSRVTERYQAPSRHRQGRSLKWPVLVFLLTFAIGGSRLSEARSPASLAGPVAVWTWSAVWWTMRVSAGCGHRARASVSLESPDWAHFTVWPIASMSNCAAAEA